MQFANIVYNLYICLKKSPTFSYVSIENFAKLITTTVREVLPQTVAYALYLLAIVRYWHNNIVTGS